MAGLRVRSALVTGTNRGIGLEIVKQLLQMPNPPEWIFAACRDPKGERAQELQHLASKHPSLVIIPLEVTDPASIQAAAARVREHLKGSGLNLLINNAAMVLNRTLDMETLQDMSQVYATNTIGPLLVSQVRTPTCGFAAQLQGTSLPLGSSSPSRDIPGSSDGECMEPWVSTKEEEMAQGP
nr:PREDICTED: 11-cis retinol dehydrogenase-like [Apteryx mantelli mantelli]